MTESHFSAAGISAARVDAVYQDADPSVDDQSEPPSGSDLHRFGSGSPFAAITLPPTASCGWSCSGTSPSPECWEPGPQATWICTPISLSERVARFCGQHDHARLRLP
jgi:hypothetical protein